MTAIGIFLCDSKKMISRKFKLSFKVLFLLFFLLIILLLYTLGSHPTRKSLSEPVRSHLAQIVPEYQSTNELDSILIYQKVLEFIRIPRNASGIIHTRTGISQESKKYSNIGLILTKNNTPLGSHIAFYVNTDKRMEVDKELYERLPQVSPLDNKHFKRCSVVGNSGLLQGSKCGTSIDKADYVFRCNLAPTDLYSEDVGQKTNLTTMNPSIVPFRYNTFKNETNVQNFVDDVNHFTGMIWMSCFGVYNLFKMCRKVLKIYNRLTPQLVFGHPGHYKYMMKYWRGRGIDKRVSTGTYLVGTAINLCDEIHLYGFWPFGQKFEDGYRLKSVPYHFYDNQTLNNVHTMNNEFTALMALHLRGVLHIHSGKCHS